MSAAQKIYKSEIKQVLLGLLTVMLISIPVYLSVYQLGFKGYVHFFSALGFGVIGAALADACLTRKLLKPLECGWNDAYLRNLPFLFFLRVLLVHTALVAVIPSFFLYARADSTHAFSLGDAAIFAMINAYLCIGHALAKFFLTETLLDRLFQSFKNTEVQSPAGTGVKVHRTSIRQKIMLTFFLLGMLPLLLIAGVSWYKLYTENIDKVGHHLAGSTLDLALTGKEFLQQDDYRFLRSLPSNMDRHLILLDSNGNILFSNRQKVLFDRQLLVEEARGKNPGWLFWKDPGVLLGFAWTQEGDRLVVQAVHPKEAALGMENIQLAIVVLAATGILIALIIGYLASKYLSRSTRMLVEGMNKVNYGDFNTRVVYATTDEFAFLGSGFNKMVKGLADREKAIKELTVGLEEKVRQRTGELETAYNHLKKAQQTITDDLNLARSVQEHLLPGKPPDLPGWKILAWASPASEVGGDLYDFITLGGGRVGIAVGDVAGKSVPAALMMTVSISILHTAAAGKSSPAQVLEHLNKMLTDIMPSRMFLTMTYAVLDQRQNCCRIANAGGPAPLFVNPVTGETRYIETTGFPLGVFPDVIYEETVVQLDTSEIMLFYSDGLVESVNEEGEFFGFPRLERLAGNLPQDLDLMFVQLIEEISKYTGGKDQYDDITIVALQRNEDGKEERQ
ncbi:MAG: PP2C family protein-serine/threonine phosphatase [Bacillota bacterium]